MVSMGGAAAVCGVRMQGSGLSGVVCKGQEVFPIRPRRQLHRFSAASSSLCSSSLQLCMHELKKPRYAMRQGLIVGAEATSSGGDEFERLAKEARKRFNDTSRVVLEKAEYVFNDVKQKVAHFQEENDLQGKAQQFANTANQKFEELGYEFKRNTEKWNREYRFTETGGNVVNYIREQVHAADRQFRISQKARTLSIDLKLKWPIYRRQFSSFLETPVGKFLSSAIFLWLLLSGWLFRIAFFSMWVLPFAAPLLIGTIAKTALVEGTCPSCKTQFIGSRGQMVICRNCRNVVWQPRDDFSKSSGDDPQIIDIDIDRK